MTQVWELLQLYPFVGRCFLIAVMFLVAPSGLWPGSPSWSWACLLSCSRWAPHTWFSASVIPVLPAPQCPAPPGCTAAHPQALAAWPPVKTHVCGLEETPALPRVVSLCSAFSDIILAIGLDLTKVKVEAPQTAFACRGWGRTTCCAVLLQ